MKKLTLIRHAKSSHKDESLADAERPLNKRGKRDGPAMGQRLARRDVHPDRILSSPAERALATARMIAGEIGYPDDEIVADERAYTFDAPSLLRLIQALDDGADHVMLVGHNPALTDIVNALADVQLENVPTCGIAELQFDIAAWSEVAPGRGSLLEFDYPKKNKK